MSRLPLLLLLTLPVSALAQAQAEAGVPQQGGEPAVLQSSIQDDQVRIDELRVRGQTRKITVQPKLPGFGAYEIHPAEPGRSPERDPKAGQRVWWSLSF